MPARRGLPVRSSCLPPKIDIFPCNLVGRGNLAGRGNRGEMRAQSPDGPLIRRGFFGSRLNRVSCVPTALEYRAASRIAFAPVPDAPQGENCIGPFPRGFRDGGHVSSQGIRLITGGKMQAQSFRQASSMSNLESGLDLQRLSRSGKFSLGSVALSSESNASS
jgi:hypothetical protein